MKNMINENVITEAGVKNIELNVIGTNINLNGNLLSEAGRYGDSAGERELAADIGRIANNQNFKNEKVAA